MDNTQFDGKVVRKPWGLEALIYSNDKVELWYLHILSSQGTSLHCHPSKKSGLVILDGQARITFMNSSSELGPLDKVMIRPGLFHQTDNIGPESLTLLEIETPSGNKDDLVRLDDRYGRIGKPYEGPEYYTDSLRDIKLTEHFKKYYLDNQELMVCTPHPLLNVLPDEIIIVLNGGLLADNDKYVLSAGDIVTGSTLIRLYKAFRHENFIYLSINGKHNERCTGNLEEDVPM